MWEEELETSVNSTNDCSPHMETHLESSIVVQVHGRGFWIQIVAGNVEKSWMKERI